MLDALLEILGEAFATLFPGCVVALGVLVLGIGATVAFATGHAHEGWVQLACLGACVLWGVAVIADRVRRRGDEHR